MKNIFSKNLTFEEQKQISKVLFWLTFILLICAGIMSILGVFADINRICIWSLLSSLALTMGFDGSLKILKRNVRTVILAVVAVSDALYVILLFFLLGRAFMRNFM